MKGTARAFLLVLYSACCTTDIECCVTFIERRHSHARPALSAAAAISGRLVSLATVSDNKTHNVRLYNKSRIEL